MSVAARRRQSALPKDFLIALATRLDDPDWGMTVVVGKALDNPRSYRMTDFTVFFLKFPASP